MADSTTKPTTPSIKSIMAGGVWRSRRIVATLALTAGIAFGAAGVAVPQADASIGWCMRCTGAKPALTTAVKAPHAVYGTRHTVYADAR